MKILPSEFRKWAFSHYGLALLLLVSIALNVLLAWRAIYWRHRVQSAEVELTEKGRQPSPVTTLLPVLRGKHLDGSEAVVEFRRPGPPTLLYLMSPGCGWCSRNLGNLHALIDQSQNKYKVVAVSVTGEGLPSYATKNRLTGPRIELLFGVSESDLEAQNLIATPQTLLVSAEGKLIKRWQGAYVQSQAEIESALNVRLPGLLD